MENVILKGTRKQFAAISKYARSTGMIYSTHRGGIYFTCVADVFIRFADRWKYETDKRKVTRKITSVDILILLELSNISSRVSSMYEMAILNDFNSQINKQLLL